MSNSYDYSEFNEFNRFENLDIIEPLIINHLVKSTTKHGNAFWKILNDNSTAALVGENVSETDRLALIEDNNGEQDTKHVTFSPFVNDALPDEGSYVHVFVEGIQPIDHLSANIGITVQVFVHSKINILNGDGDPMLNPDKPYIYGYYYNNNFYEDSDHTKKLDHVNDTIFIDLSSSTPYIKYVWDDNSSQYVETQNSIYGANPNESDENDNLIILTKSRATVLMKSVIAELNGLYLDGIGYMRLRERLSTDPPGTTYTHICNHKSFSGYEIKFVVELSGISESSAVGY